MFGILVAMLFASCGSESGNLQKGPGIKVTAIADTSIIVETPLTAPRYACGTGNRLKHDKYLGSDIKLVSVSDTESVFLSNDSLSKIGYIYRPGETVVKDESSDESIFTSPTNPSGWLAELVEILFAVILGGATLWLLWWLFSQRPASRTTSTPVTSATPGAAAAVNPGSGGNPPVSSPTPAPSTVSPSHQEIVNHLKDLMTTMQQTGTIELDYSTRGHELHLKNSGKKPAEKEKKVTTEKPASSDQVEEKK